MKTRPSARRIYGIETEYGLTCASLDGETPPMNADQAARELFRPVVERGRSSNVFTRNGGRLYLDVGSHPEFATAECDRLEDLLAHDRAGEMIMADLVRQVNVRLAQVGVPGEVHVLKNNLDAEGTGFGCHENYLVRRQGDFWNDARTLVPHLVTRQILVGAGHILHDPEGESAPQYVFSQRADQMWDAVSSATTRARPLINTRDEPHADAERYRRMHVIVGDSNVSPSSTLLKVAVMDLLLDYLEHGGSLADLALADPMSAIRETCRDLSGQVPLELADGRRLTPVEIQREHLERIRLHCEQLELTELQVRALDLWERGLQAVASGDHSTVDTELDWAIKLRLLERYTSRAGIGLDDPRVARLNLAYHDVSPSAGLRSKLLQGGLMASVISERSGQIALEEPPATTRAALRGRAVGYAEEWRRDLTVDWVNLRLDDGSTPMVSLKDPFQNVDERVDELIAAMESTRSILPE